MVDGVLLDLDGVFYVGDDLLPGALEALAQLRESRLPLRFITNTTTRSSASLLAKLQGLGIDASGDELMTAPRATADYLRRHGFRRCYFAVAPEVMSDFDGQEHVVSEPDAVVVADIGAAWSYDLVDRLFGYLLDGAVLVAMHRNRYWRTPEGLHVDIGAFVAGLEYAASVEAVITGKPSRAFFDAAVASMGLSNASQVILVGDDIDSDVGGAQEAGLQGVLVKTGKYREDLVAASPVTPDRVIDTIGAIGDCL